MVNREGSGGRGAADVGPGGSEAGCEGERIEMGGEGVGRASGGWAWQGWVGGVLIAIAWPLNWGLEGLRTHLLFFPLWLGYCWVVDAWTLRRTGTSPMVRGWRRYWLGYLVSMPLWWLFELFNLRLGNWEYIGREAFSDLEYFLLASLSFSTVLPAVLGTSELVRSWGWVERMGRGPRVEASARNRRGWTLFGAAMLVVLLVWPRQGFPFVWTSLVFLVEPLNARFGRRAFTTHLRYGDWRPWVSLWIGGLICGFFWEFWNAWSHPKWIYHVPYVGFGKVFEMPVLGYLGYLPFAMELYLFEAWIGGRGGPRLGPERPNPEALGGLDPPG